ncbi:MAG: DNA polymerase I [Acidobacteriota bacterium]
MSVKKNLPRLWLVDGTANIFRAYYALRGRFITRDGLPTNAIYGFTAMLRKLIKDAAPGYLGVCFDRAEPTFRHEQYAAYKANRPEPPEDLIRQIPLVLEITRAHNIPVVERQGWEADDLMGTLARQAVEAGFDVVLVSSDKDLYQLVGDHVMMMNPHKNNLMVDAAGVKKVFGVRPDQVADVLALMGDATDNIPGVPGIGEKGAKSLLAEFETLENLLNHARSVKKRSYREALLNHQDQARLSYSLATVRLDAPVTFDPETLKMGPPDIEHLRRIFARLEFNSLLKDLSPASSTSGAHYRAVSKVPELKKVLEEIEKAGRVSVDLETTGLDPMRVEILGIALSVAPGEAVYIPIRHQAGVTEQIDPDTALRLLKPMLESPGVLKVGQNCKYEYVVLRRAGIRLCPVDFDTMIATYLLDPARSHKLDDLAADFLGVRMIPYTDLAGKGSRQVTLDQVDLARVVDYAGEDADIALRLVDRLRPELEASRLFTLFSELEMPLVPILGEMEHAGVRIDTEHLRAMSRRLEADMGRVQARIHAEVGCEFNINSPKQLGEILFHRLGLKPLGKTAKTRAFSTSQAVLEELAAEHPVCAWILEWRSLAKLRGTYTEALPALVHPDTGRVHTSFNQAATATGRLSSSDPNLQNIPARGEIGREIRRAFIPADGAVLLVADYNQVELRILAHLSGDPVLLQAFRSGEDIHTRTAAEIFGVDDSLVTREMRQRAKAINFGILYGMGPQRLAREQGVPFRDARAFISSYFERFAQVKQYIDATVAFAEAHGYVATLLGRIRRFPELETGNRMIRQQALRAAVNTTIQGTAADLIKKAMIAIHTELLARELEGRMILQVHDELVLEVRHRALQEVSSLVQSAMETVYPLKVPLTVDLGSGPSWLGAKES